MCLCGRSDMVFMSSSAKGLSLYKVFNKVYGSISLTDGVAKEGDIHSEIVVGIGGNL